MNLCFWFFRRMVKTPAKTGFVCAQRLMENRTLIWWQGGKSMGTVQAPDAYTWLRHGTWKNPIARTMLRIENIPNICVRIRYCCFGWPAMVIPRTFCSSIVASVKTCYSQECFLLDWCKSWAFCTQVRWTQLPTQREVLPMQWTASKQRTLGALPVKFAEAD